VFIYADAAHCIASVTLPLAHVPFGDDVGVGNLPHALVINVHVCVRVRVLGWVCCPVLERSRKNKH
jgi:hypothetical protein